MASVIRRPFYKKRHWVPSDYACKREKVDRLWESCTLIIKRVQGKQRVVPAFLFRRNRKVCSMANNENRKRPIQKKIRLSAEESEYIKSKVDESPFDNFQNFARNLLIQREVTVKDFTELERLNGQVKRIGNNINQIVKLAHQFDEISDDDIEEVIHLLEEVKNLITEKLKKEAE